MPERIQRRRTKGWRMPEGAIYVGRPTRFGNPHHVGECRDCWWGRHEGDHSPATQADVVDMYRIVEGTMFAVLNDPPIRLLRGHDLACWCPLCDEHADGLPLGVECPDCTPCHATYLLEMANA